MVSTTMWLHVQFLSNRYNNFYPLVDYFKMSPHQWNSLITFIIILFPVYMHISFASDGLVYIRTSAESPCPAADPCITLSQLATNLTEYLSDNMTLIFLQGNHSLDRKLQFVNITTITVKVTEFSHTHSASENVRIVCGLKYASFIFNEVEFVSINNLNFMGCSHKFESVGVLMIENASFQGNNYTGSAVEMIHTMSACIQQSFFTFNTNGNYLGPIGIFVYENSHYPDNLHNTTTYANVGGAVIVAQSELKIIDSVFENNSAMVGGAIFSWQNSNITILNSSFSGNLARLNGSACFGGAIHFESDNYNRTGPTAKDEIILSIYNTTFVRNIACHQGGAISGFYSHISMKGCNGFQNMALYGGVIGAIKTVINIEDDCHFEQNVAAFSGGGGVMAAFYETILKIKNGTFMLNTADYGGVIAADLGSSCMIFNSVFDSNSANTAGGAIYMLRSGIMNINSSEFFYNTADLGGAIAVGGSVVNIYHSQFYSNNGFSEGGVMIMLPLSQFFSQCCQFANNSAPSGGVLSLEVVRNVILLDNHFRSNTAIQYGGVVVLKRQSNLVIQRCQFIGNKADQGGVLHAQLGPKVTVKESNFSNTTSEVLLSLGYGIMTIERCTFVDNIVPVGGVVSSNINSTVYINDSHFQNNLGLNNGSTLYTGHGSSMVVSHCSFRNNRCLISGSAMILERFSHAIISDSNFTGNLAQRGGGVIHVYISSDLTLQNIRASNNTAVVGGVLFLETQSTARIKDSSFIDNNATMGGAIMIFNSISINISNCVFSQNCADKGTFYFVGVRNVSADNIILSNNSGSIYMYNSVVNFTGKVSIIDNSSPHSIEAGGITALQSNVFFDNGTFQLLQNNAEKGGAIHAMESTIYISNGDTIIGNNKAWNSGGGLYLYRSEINCNSYCALRITNNTAFLKGGGVYTMGSSIKVYFGRELHSPRGKIYISENKAGLGGGVCLEGNAKLSIFKYGLSLGKTVFLGYGFYFMANIADYGGAVYIADETNVETCDSNYHTATTFNNGNASECSIQVISLEASSSYTAVSDLRSIIFQENSAQRNGATIFGGLFDRCIPSPFAEIFYKSNMTLPDNGAIDGVTYIQYFSNICLDKISSKPVRLCFCHNGQHNCSYQHPDVEVKKGETFTVTLVAVDQVNHTVPNVSIHSYLLSPESSLVEGQYQMTSEYCTDLLFSITSSSTYEQLIVYGDGPCKDAYVSQSRINVQFTTCTCPIGFQENFIYHDNCVCECNAKLFPEYISDCNIQSKTVLRRPKCWISYFDDTDNNSFISGYLTYSYCPFDYCVPSEIELNLNIANGVDTQCAHNRQGLLCGACKSGFSLSLGSSHCLICTNWSSNFSITISIAFLAGIGTVALILVLNLTVASGTIGGIVFYANIVNAGSNAFLAFATPNVITVVISWLNLDIGIDTCFYNGMDAYQKAWIELLFPTYLILLVVLLIIVSEHSTKFAVLIGRKNPVATLATLILLSYTKFLRTIITSLSFAILYYPNHSNECLWLPDATVKYLRGKHVVLFLAAVLILLAGALYTSVLFAWQWLLRHQNMKLFKWTQNHKLYHFIETYNAPYAFNHRYWTGLLLLVRTILYIITSVNVSNDPAINLLAVGVIISTLLLLKICLKVYKNKWNDYLETACFFNITLFSFVSLYFLESEGNQTIIAYISGSFTLTLLLVVFVYHTYKEIILKLRNKLCKRADRPILSPHQIDQPYMYASRATEADDDDEMTTSVAPTSSVIDAPPQERPLMDVLKSEKLQKERSNVDDLSQDSESDTDEQQPLIQQ